MTKKYEAKHQFVKELGLKGMFAEAADTAADLGNTIASNAGPIEVIEFIVWGSFSYLIFVSGTGRKLLEGGNVLVQLMSNDPQEAYSYFSLEGTLERFKQSQAGGLWYGFLSWFGIPSPYGQTTPEKAEEEKQKAADLFPEILVSMVAAWAILKGVGSIKSIIAGVT